MGWAKLRNFVKNNGSEMQLYLGRRIVGHHSTEILETATHDHHSSDTHDGEDKLIERRSLEDQGDKPAEQG